MGTRSTTYLKNSLFVLLATDGLLQFIDELGFARASDLNKHIKSVRDGLQLPEMRHQLVACSFLYHSLVYPVFMFIKVNCSKQAIEMGDVARDVESTLLKWQSDPESLITGKNKLM